MWGLFSKQAKFDKGGRGTKKSVFGRTSLMDGPESTSLVRQEIHDVQYRTIDIATCKFQGI